MATCSLFCFTMILGIFQIVFAIQTTDIVSCRVWGEPHIQTWTKSAPPSVSPCTNAGRHLVMNNAWIQFFMEVSLGYATKLTIDFRDGVTMNSICNLQLSGTSKKSTSEICTQNGILVSDLGTSTSIHTTSIVYPKAELNAVIVRDSSISPSHFNVQIWKPANQNSTGLCTKDTCTSSARSLFSQPSFKMPMNKAKQICDDYIKNYLNKLSRIASQRDINYNSTISMVTGACAFDVALTGNANAARSALEMLMIEELTTEAADMKSLITQFQRGIRDATETFDEANHELKKIVANVQ